MDTSMFYHSTHPVKMRNLLALLVVCVASLCVRCDENVYTLMDRVLVLKMPDPPKDSNVSLVCGEAYPEEDVFWKKNGGKINLVGNKVNVVVKEMVAGNFSCHLKQDGRYLNHTLLLVQSNPVNRTLLKTRSEEGSTKHILCSGHNFCGSFHCSWSITNAIAYPNAAVLLVKAERNSSEIDCELEADGSGVWCNERICEPQEEQQRIELRVYMYSNPRMDMYVTQFYLRDIVSPERVANLHEEKNNEFHWEVPESWEKPSTYYQVQFEVAVHKKDGSCLSPASLIKKEVHIIDENKFMVTLKKKRYMFCVRARDKFTGGPWGEWSHVMKKHRVASGHRIEGLEEARSKERREHILRKRSKMKQLNEYKF